MSEKRILVELSFACKVSVRYPSLKPLKMRISKKLTGLKAALVRGAIRLSGRLKTAGSLLRAQCPYLLPWLRQQLQRLAADAFSLLKLLLTFILVGRLVAQLNGSALIPSDPNSLLQEYLLLLILQKLNVLK